MSILSSVAARRKRAVMRARGEDTPLLIVNADDWGYDAKTTDAILASFEANQITSTSAMVFMADSDRAARIALERDLPIGMHLNLTEPFSDPETPAAARELQLRAISHLGESEASSDPAAVKLRRWVYDPRLQGDVDALINVQLDRFVELYGRQPTHFDGHNHIDLCPNVFLSRSIPAGAKMRNSRDCFPLDRSFPGLLRACRQGFRSRRLATTTYLLHMAFLDLDQPGKLDPLLDLCDRMPIEVMAHPAFEWDGGRLQTEAWTEVMASHKLGSFADLRSRPHRLRDWLRP